MPGFEGLVKVEILIQLVAVDRHLDTSHVASPPDIVTHFQLVSEPFIGLNQSFVDVAHAIQGSGANRIRMGTIDLSLISIQEARLARGSKIQTGISFVVDLNLSAVLEVL